MSGIGNDIINAVEIVANNVVNNLAIDKTIVCNISSYNEKDNSYIVSNDQIKFKAYPSGEEVYEEGDQVNVLIPSGNYGAEKKNITGTYSKKEQSVYTDSFDDLIIICEQESNNSLFFQKNYDNYYALKKGTIQSDAGDNFYTAFEDSVQKYYGPILENNENNFFTVLKVSCWINTENLNSEQDYLLRFNMRYNKKDGEIKKFFNFYNYDIKGNPYMCDGNFCYEKVFILNKNYIDYSNDKIYFDVEQVSLNNDNDKKISINKIRISLGYRQQDIQEEKIIYKKTNFGFVNKQVIFNSYGGIIYLIKKDSSGKYRYYKNSLPEDFSLNFDIGYNFKQDKDNISNVVNNNWKWETKTIKNTPYIFLLYNGFSTNNNVLLVGELEDNKYWVPRTKNEFNFYQDSSSSDNPAKNGPKNVSAIGLRFQDNKDFYYWALKEDNNKFFITLDDDTYKNGYYLHSVKKNTSKDIETDEIKTVEYCQLINKKDEEVSRKISFHFADDLINQISKIKLYTNSQKKSAESGFTIFPMIFNWENNFDGSFYSYHDSQVIQKLFDKEQYEQGFPIDDTYGIDLLIIDKVINGISFNLASSFDKIDTSSQTLLCELYDEDNSLLACDWITLNFYYKEGISLQLKQNTNYSGCIKVPFDDILFEAYDKYTGESINLETYFSTLDIKKLVSFKFIQSGIQFENETDSPNNIFHILDYSLDNQYLKVKIELNNTILNKNIINNYFILEMTLQGKSTYEAEEVIVKKYLSLFPLINSNLKDFNLIFYNSENKEIIHDGIFYENIEKNLYDYRNILSDHDKDEEVFVPYLITGLPENYSWSVYIDKTYQTNASNEGFESIKHETQLYYIKYPFFKDIEKNQFILNTNQPRSFRYNKSCIIIRNENEEIVNAMPLYIVPYEEKGVLET